MPLDRRLTRGTPLLALLVLVAGCSEGDGGGEADTLPNETASAEGRPEMEVPDGEDPPEDLVREDLAEGDGAEVRPGALLTLHYAGITWSGSEFANTWERGEPLVYTHGEGRWVEGWSAGIDGMREGGQRRIVVPAELAYGDRGAPGIPPDEALVFVVHLLAVETDAE